MAGGFDAWPDLPASRREAVLAAGREGWRRVFDGVASYNESDRPLRPVFLTAERYDELTVLTDRLLQLVLDACRRRAGTAGELRKAVGVPDGLIEFVDDDEPVDEHLVMSGRPDLLISDGVPKLVEFNVGSDVGSAWDSDQVSARFHRLYAEHGIGGFAPPPVSATEGRFAAIAGALGMRPGERLSMVFRSDGDYPGMDDVDGLIRALDPFVEQARGHGLDMDIVPVSRLRLDAAQRLWSGDRPVDGILRMFVCSGMPGSAGLDAMTAALRSGTVRMFTTSASWLLGNKLVLAWLWEDVDGLPDADAELVRRHVPRTRLLTSGLLAGAVAGREGLVLKPADEFGGNGVLVGAECDAGRWRADLEDAVRRGGHLVQDYVRPDRLTHDFVGLVSGDVVRAEVPFSVGPYTFGRRGAGCYLRIGSPDAGGEVLNLHRGIHVTGPLLVTGQGRG